MDANIRIEVDEVIRKFKEAGHEITTKATQAVAKGCLVVERDAKHLAPVDTGLLRASITHRVLEEDGEIVGQVGTNVEYAPYVEFGTSRGQAPKPFLYPALMQNELEVKYVIAKALKGVLGNDDD